MEPSQVFGVTEECNSSESGWTMYIGSPVNSFTDDDKISTDEEAEDYDYTDPINDEESDDSMASDASSGPSNQGHSLTLFNREKKPLMEKKKMEKKKMEKKKEEEDEREDQSVLMAKKGKASSSQSSGRVKKSSWMTKTRRNN